MTIPDWYHRALQDTARIERLGVFFVLGCQKSGTTWVARLLDEHPQVVCRGEGHLTDVLAPMLEIAVNGYNDMDKTAWPLPVEDLLACVRLLGDRLLGRYLDAAGAAPATKVVGDKTPEAALAMPQLANLYPSARFVHVIRDGRDGAVSGWAHLKRQGRNGRFASFAEYAGYFAGQHWRPYIERARQAAAALPGRHAPARDMPSRHIPPRYVEVRYEALLERPADSARALLEFLGVDARDDVVASCVEGAAFERLSGGRRRGEENSASHFRKGVAGDWKTHFDDTAQRRFEEEAGGLLRELGYASPAAAV